MSHAKISPLEVSVISGSSYARRPERFEDVSPSQWSDWHWQQQMPAGKAEPMRERIVWNQWRLNEFTIYYY